jgi:hypothetical protein
VLRCVGVLGVFCVGECFGAKISEAAGLPPADFRSHVVVSLSSQEESSATDDRIDSAGAKLCRFLLLLLCFLFSLVPSTEALVAVAEGEEEEEEDFVVSFSFTAGELL